MHRRVVACHNREVQPAIQQRPYVIQRHAPIELHECAIDYSLKVTSREHAGVGERQEVPPRFRRETSTLMRSDYPKSHQLSQVLYAALPTTWGRAGEKNHRIRATSTFSTSEAVERPGIIPVARPNDRWAVNLPPQILSSEAGDLFRKSLYINDFRIQYMIGRRV